MTLDCVAAGAWPCEPVVAGELPLSGAWHLVPKWLPESGRGPLTSGLIDVLERFRTVAVR